MKSVAVFGNAGGGKSTLSRRLAVITGLPLYTLDTIQFREGRYWPGEPGGGKLSNDTYLALHREILARDRWIIDGYGSVASAWERFAAADTLVYVDLPLRVHYWRITKRLMKGLFRNPDGWPANSPVLKSSLDSYRVVGLCHRELTPKYRALIADVASTKRVVHLQSPAKMREFLDILQNQSPCGVPPQ